MRPNSSLDRSRPQHLTNRSSWIPALTLGLSLALTATAPSVSAACKSRLAQEERTHFFNIHWQAPTQFEDGATDLNASNDLWGYNIWRVDADDPSKKIEILATADKDDTHCQVFVRKAQDYAIAMESVAHETSALSAAQTYASLVAPVATVARQ